MRRELSKKTKKTRKTGLARNTGHDTRSPVMISIPGIRSIPIPDCCPKSTDGMLFVISRPNRQKSQTNNKRKGEKYGNWSYSYHRW